MSAVRTTETRRPVQPPRNAGDLDTAAAAAGLAAAALVGVAIYAGSAGLRSFDAALTGYATGTVVMVLAVTYRCVLWARRPPARRALARTGSALAAVPARVPRAVLSHLLFQTFIRRRGVGRWLAHQGLFWGVTLAALVTFPLTFGWIAFRAVPGTGSGYTLVALGVPVFRFDALSLLGWLTFHVLDVAAVLVIGGCAYFLWRRARDRGVPAGRHLGGDMLPLLALVLVSVTGLLLTVSTALFQGLLYGPLALLHMATVVLTMVFLPFGKLFHAFQRPAGLGVHLQAKADLLPCAGCGAPVAGAAALGDLRASMGELGLDFAGWAETCPACKRRERGAAYLRTVKEGFR